MQTLRNYRENRKLTQKEAAKLLDVTTVYLSMLECGHRNPSDSLKSKMAKLYGISVTDIYSCINFKKQH